MQMRIRVKRRMAKRIRPLLLAARVFAPNRAARRKVGEVAGRYREVFGRPNLRQILASFAILFTTTVEAMRIGLRRLFGLGDLNRQPPMQRIEYPDRTPTAAFTSSIEESGGPVR